MTNTTAPENMVQHAMLIVLALLAVPAACSGRTRVSPVTVSAQSRVRVTSQQGAVEGATSVTSEGNTNDGAGLVSDRVRAAVLDGREGSVPPATNELSLDARAKLTGLAITTASHKVRPEAACDSAPRREGYSDYIQFLESNPNASDSEKATVKAKLLEDDQ